MHLHTAIVPPLDVLDEVVAAVQAACPPEQAPEAEPPATLPPGGARWLRRRPRTSKVPDPEAAPALLPQLDLVPLEEMSIPVAGFGKVTSGDHLRLAAALRRVADQTPRPTLRLAGATALEFEGDRHVWLRVAGGTDVLSSAMRELTTVVEQLGFYVDRRKFRPLLAVATVTSTATADYLQEVVDSLDKFSGRSWELDHVHLMRLTYGAGPEAQELDRFYLQG